MVPVASSRFFVQRRYLSTSRPEAEFLDEIQTKVLRVFLLAIQSPLFCSSALRFLFLKLTKSRTVFTVQFLCSVKEKGGKPYRKICPFPIHTETSSLRTLKIMSRNLNKISRSQIRLQKSPHNPLPSPVKGLKNYPLATPLSPLLSQCGVST
jgi:hypothetical protein